MRDCESELEATEYSTTPFPVPLLPDVIVIQESLLTAVQSQVGDVTTETLPVPPFASNDSDVGVIA
jgi:hypothetical protein